MLDLGVVDIVHVVCVIGVELKSALHMLHVRYVLVIKWLQLDSTC